MKKIQAMLKMLFVAALGAASAVLPLTAHADRDARSGGGEAVALTRIGAPLWKPVDARVFSAPIGTAADGYAGFVASALAVLPPPHHAFHPQLAVGPGTPHMPPYDDEISDGVRNAHFLAGAVFAESHFSNGNGVFAMWMNVPAPGTAGSSPDFALGRVIPNFLFPIHVAGIAYRNGALYDRYLGTFDLPAINDPGLTPSWNVGGHSHFPVFYADNADFGPEGTPVHGHYLYDIVMTDRTGAGWHIQAHFLVVPTPLAKR